MLRRPLTFVLVVYVFIYLNNLERIIMVCMTAEVFLKTDDNQ